MVKEILPTPNPDSAVQPKLLKYLRPSQADAVQVIPPDKLDDFIRRGMNNDSVDHSTDEVIPPTTPGGRGMTEAEFKALRPEATITPTERGEVIPPSQSGGPGLTASEVRTKPSQKGGTANNAEVPSKTRR